MQEYIIGFLCLVAGTLLGIYLALWAVKVLTREPTCKTWRQHRRESKQHNSSHGDEGGRLREKLAAKEQSYTDFCSVADGFDATEHIRGRQPAQDGAYNSLLKHKR